MGKVLEFKRSRYKADLRVVEGVVMTNDDFDGRMNKIRQDLKKISKLMNDIKNNNNEYEELV